MTKDIKEVIATAINCYLRNTYNAVTSIDNATIVKTLSWCDDIKELFRTSFQQNSIEDFVMGYWFEDYAYVEGSKNCAVSVTDFAKKMNGNEIFGVLKKFDISWIDCLYATLNNDKDICQAIHDEIFPPKDEEKSVVTVKNENPNDNGNRQLRVQENAIEIAMNVYHELYDNTDQPRDVIITKIQSWAEEAEKVWEDGKHDGEYLDFIDAFSNKKKEEFLEECLGTDEMCHDSKKVSVNLNVEVTFDVDGKVDDEGIKNLARQMVADKMDCDLNTCYGNETYVGYNVSVVNDIDKTYLNM